MMGSTGTVNRNYELLIMSLAAAFAIAVSCACTIRARDVSDAAYVQDLSIGPMQTVADLAAAGKGDMSAVAAFYGDACSIGADGSVTVRFDERMQPVDGSGRARYVVRAGAAARDGFLGTCTVTLEQDDGTVVWCITASWQER